MAGKIEKVRNPDKLGLGRLLLWKSSDVSAAWVNVITLNFLSLYCSDTLGINIGVVSTLLLASKIVDGFTDIFAGWLVDNTHTKWGKGRPYELGIVGMTICSILIFAGDPAWSNVVKCAWIFCMYTFTFSVFATLRQAAGNPYTIRHFSNNKTLLTKVSSYGGIVTMAGSMILNIVFPILQARIATSASGWTAAVALVMIPATLIGLLRFIFCKEDPSVDATSKQDPIKLKEIFMLFRRNKYVWFYAIIMLCYNIITTLADDMLTVTSETSRIVPSQFMALGTSFEGHGFYEASSIRKIGSTYYFIYSDENSNMLCYATSQYPDRDFTYQGILQSNGDVGLHGRKGEDRLNMTANNHGSLECVNGQWYIFYHRHTHNSTYSRQACAEPVTIALDGSITQVECTSCGLNGGPLRAEGEYPAAIACSITNGKMPHATNRVVNADIPHITHSGEGAGAERYIANIKHGTRIVFKYFSFDGPVRLTLTLRGKGGGHFAVLTGEQEQGCVATSGNAWQEVSLDLWTEGVHPLELQYTGDGTAELLAIRFDKS